MTNATIFSLVRIENSSIFAVGFGFLHDLLCDKDCPVAVRNIEKKTSRIFCMKNVTVASSVPRRRGLCVFIANLSSLVQLCSFPDPSAAALLSLFTMAETKGKFDFAIDRGGTFTDVFARLPDGRERVLKLLSRDPQNYKDAPTEGIRRVLEEVILLIPY